MYPLVIHLPCFHGGGAEVVMVKLANYWREQGRDVTMVVNSEEGSVRDRLSPLVSVISLGDLRTSRSLPRLVGYVKQARPPLLISALISANIAAAAAIRLSGARTAHVALARNFVSREITEEPPARRLFAAPALRWALRGAHRVGCVCSSVRDDVIAWAGVVPGRVEVTFNPIDPVDRSALTPPSEYSGGGPVVVSVGRLSEQKNYPLLLEAASRVRQERAFRLFILGTGPLEAALRARIAELGLKDIVHLLGYRPDAQRYIACADLLVLASRYEGFPNVVAEALAAGTTPVATDAPGGARELLGDGQFGYLPRPDDAASIADAMIRAIDQPKNRSVLRARAGDFSVDRIAACYISLFDAALAERMIAR